MKNPDVEVRVEVIQGHTYIYARSLVGVGGLPVGTAGKVMCLISSGIDSPVATWRLARRGAVCVGIHFSGRPELLIQANISVMTLLMFLKKQDVSLSFS